MVQFMEFGIGFLYSYFALQLELWKWANYSHLLDIWQDLDFKEVSKLWQFHGDLQCRIISKINTELNIYVLFCPIKMLIIGG